jgi:hypothetical protein
VDPSGLQEIITPVPFGLGCTTLITKGLASGSLENFMASQSIPNYESAAQVLVASWSRCWCQMYKQYGVKSEDNISYSDVARRMCELKQDLLKFVERANSGCNLLSNLSFGIPRPSDCEAPNLPQYQEPCTDIFDPRGEANLDAVIPPVDFSRIKSVGAFFNASFIAKYGKIPLGFAGAILIMFKMENALLDTSVGHVYVSSEAGAVISLSGTGLSPLSIGTNLIWSTSDAHDFQGTSATFGTNLLNKGFSFKGFSPQLSLSRTFGSCNYSASIGITSAGSLLSFTIGGVFPRTTTINFSNQDIQKLSLFVQKILLGN